MNTSTRVATILIDANGDLNFLYDDALRDFMSIGRPSIKRASHVEPTPTGEWEADMALSDGPILGPFLTRSEALAAEEKWLLETRRYQ